MKDVLVSNPLQQTAAADRADSRLSGQATRSAQDQLLFK